MMIFVLDWKRTIVPTYFKPLRRKLGVMTLVTALAFLASWIRSFGIGDQIVISTSTHWTNSLGSIRGKLIIGEGFAPAYSSKPPRWIGMPASARMYEWMESQWECLGFGIYELPVSKSPIIYRVFTIPYWSIVIPLTLLSALLLLLSKPRKPATPPDSLS